jgi:hypothetical protein
MINEKKTIICLHIPKTGGVSLNQIAKKQYKDFETAIFRAGPNFFEFKDNDHKKESLKYIQGHLGFGFHDLYSIDATYITMLRNPIDRVISNYYFILQNEKHFLHNELKDNNYTLKKYVESGIALNTDNCQVRYLSGNVDIPHNTCNQEMLKEAKNNLTNHFSVIGVQEHYNAFLMLMKEIHGWKIPFYKKYNTTKKRRKITEIDDETLTIIEEHNQLDIELYLYAKNLIEKEIEKRGKPFQKNLTKFNKNNKIYQKISSLKNKILSSN